MIAPGNVILVCFVHYFRYNRVVDLVLGKLFGLTQSIMICVSMRDFLYCKPKNIRNFLNTDPRINEIGELVGF